MSHINPSAAPELSAGPELSRLAVHSITTKPWSIEEACEQYAAHGVRGISVWMEAIEGRNVEDVKRMVDDAGLKVPALVRGGFFCAPTALERLQKIEDNRRLIDTAAAIGAEMLVLVVGAVPGEPLETQREWVREGIEKLVPFAEQHNVRLAIEPLHPMYAGDRSCVTTLSQARQLCEKIDHPSVGIAVDVYHVWWDDRLEDEIRLLGARGELFAFHLCDWRCPTRDMLNDRALMGDGCIDITTIRRWMCQAGFTGWEEVEIFSHEHWSGDQSAFLKQLVNRYLSLVKI